MRVSKLNKVMTKKLSISKFDKRLYWTSNVNNEPENLINYFKKNKKKKFNKFIAEKPQFNHLELRPSDIKGFQFLNTLKVSVITYLKRIYGSYKGYRKGKNMYALSEFAYIWRKRKDYLWLRKNADLTSKDLIRKKIKYIYFPLTAEPETAMHGLAEDFFFQLTAINMLSRDLPADYKILVKEHLFAIGRRPNNFYNQIKELKNVLMADPLEYGINFLNNASAVSVVVGTSGWEAAAMGIPVISFTKHNSYNFLDHVFTVKEPDDTKGILQQIKLKKYPSKKSIHDGAKMHDSYIDLSFKFDKNKIFQNWDQEKNTKPSKDFIKKIYDNLYLKN